MRLCSASALTPFSQGAFREEHDIAFDLVSDMDREAIEAYDLEIDLPDLGLYGVANRTAFVLDAEVDRLRLARRRSDERTELRRTPRGRRIGLTNAQTHTHTSNHGIHTLTLLITERG